MDQMREAYGSRLPGNDIVNKYLPVRIRVPQGKAKMESVCYPARVVQGFAAVYWDGTGGPRHFRQPCPQGSLIAHWTSCSGSEGTDLSVPVTDLYEDPVFYNTTKVSSEKFDQLIDPNDAPKITYVPAREHKYTYVNLSLIHI